MHQEKDVPEVELKDQTGDVAKAVDNVIDETTRLVDSLAKAVMTTAQDMTSIMILRVDRETREHLDLLIDAGAAKHRREAARRLIATGIESEQEFFEKVRRTKAQIKALRHELRALVQVKAT